MTVGFSPEVDGNPGLRIYQVLVLFDGYSLARGIIFRLLGELAMMQMEVLRSLD